MIKRGTSEGNKHRKGEGTLPVVKISPICGDRRRRRRRRGGRGRGRRRRS